MDRARGRIGIGRRLDREHKRRDLRRIIDSCRERGPTWRALGVDGKDPATLRAAVFNDPALVRPTRSEIFETGGLQNNLDLRGAGGGDACATKGQAKHQSQTQHAQTMNCGSHATAPPWLCVRLASLLPPYVCMLAAKLQLLSVAMHRCVAAPVMRYEQKRVRANAPAEW